MRPQIHDSLRLVQAEYLEMPGLILTKPQVRRFWGFDEFTCDQVLDALEAEHFLRRTAGESYALDVDFE
jgi:hypothetical protein